MLIEAYYVLWISILSTVIYANIDELINWKPIFPHAEAPIAVIDGLKYAYIIFDETQASHVDDISMRFQTPLKNATLFHTTAKNSTDSMDVSLVNGEVVLVITVNGITRVRM